MIVKGFHLTITQGKYRSLNGTLTLPLNDASVNNPFRRAITQALVAWGPDASWLDSGCLLLQIACWLISNQSMPRKLLRFAYNVKKLKAFCVSFANSFFGSWNKGF